MHPNLLMNSVACDELQVNQFLLSTKDKKACAVLHASVACDEQENCSSQRAPISAEIQALYQLPTGAVSQCCVSIFECHSALL